MKILAQLVFAVISFSFSTILCPGVARADSAFDYINTPSFAIDATHFYLGQIIGNAQRRKIIDTAKDECGGRYENIDLKITEISHEVSFDKRYIRTPNPKTYRVAYDGRAEDTFIVIETIHCSVHGGHNLSVLHAETVSGVETRTITYSFKNDLQEGKPSLSKALHTFTVGSIQLADQYKTPYGTVIAP